MDPTDPRPIVLYVEDHAVNVLLMQAVFERRPRLRLVVATTGAEALQRAIDLHPVLLLLDLNLPDCHGAALLPQLRLLPGCGTAPAVAATADHQFQIEGTDFVALWPKPLDLGMVFRYLDSLVDGLALPQAPLPGLQRVACQAQRLPN